MESNKPPKLKDVDTTATAEVIKQLSIDPITAIAANLPIAVIGTYDPLQHKTVEDLCALVQHELDLFEEGEDTDIKNIRDVLACQKFLKMYAVNPKG